MLTIREDADSSTAGICTVWKAQSNERHLGTVEFDLFEKTMTLVKVDCQDEAVLDGLVRAALTAGIRNGYTVYSLSKEVRQSDNALLGLESDEERPIASLFSNSCKAFDTETRDKSPR